MLAKGFTQIAIVIACFIISYGIGKTVLSGTFGAYFLYKSGYTQYSNGDYHLELPGSSLAVLEVGRTGKSDIGFEMLETWFSKGRVGEVVCQSNYYKEGVFLNIHIGHNGELALFNNFYDGVQLDLYSSRGGEEFFRYLDLDSDGDIDVMLEGDGKIVNNHAKRRVGNTWANALYDETTGEWTVE